MAKSLGGWGGGEGGEKVDPTQLKDAKILYIAKS